MDANTLKTGERIEHPLHGPGTIRFVGTDYLGIDFDRGGEALIRREAFAQSMAQTPSTTKHGRRTLSWPQSTFIAEAADTPHYMGSHWSPFVNAAKEILVRLPELLPLAMPQTGYGEARPSPRAAPADWPAGVQLVWPRRDKGLAVVLHVGKDANHIVTLFPFFAGGSQQALVLHEVRVWQGGLEAQITAAWGEGEVSFFDTQYPINRAWYEAGGSYEFLLAGLAYDARPAEHREFTINRHPDEVAWMNSRLPDDEEPHTAATTVSFDGAAMLLPIEGWDIDDHQFRAPVKTVEEFTDWLGQDGWRVRAAVMRFGDEDGDLDILITRRAWKGDAPPRVGQDIEGQLWLQGRLWMPSEPSSAAARRGQGIGR